MKKFKFHMEKLLSYKEQILDSEMMNLAALNDLMQRADDKLTRLENEREKYKEEFENKIKEQITPAQYKMYDSYENHISNHIEQCKGEIKEIEKRIEDQIEIVKELKVETKSLETIKENRYAEYKKEEIKKEEIFIDEFVSGIRIKEHAN